MCLLLLYSSMMFSSWIFFLFKLLNSLRINNFSYSILVQQIIFALHRVSRSRSHNCAKSYEMMLRLHYRQLYELVGLCWKALRQALSHHHVIVNSRITQQHSLTAGSRRHKSDLHRLYGHQRASRSSDRHVSVVRCWESGLYEAVTKQTAIESAQHSQCILFTCQCYYGTSTSWAGVVSQHVCRLNCAVRTN